MRRGIHQRPRAEHIAACASTPAVRTRYHPWNGAQGHSAFVWSVIGALSQATDLPVTTGVTCPTMRIHPAIIAQAAATAAAMMPGRFCLGVGTGENLNEHILGDHWPPHDLRLAMLAEAIDVIRRLWQGGTQSYRGCYYTVENACLYTLPDALPPILVAASGPKAAEAAGRLSDGLISTSPQQNLVENFEAAGGHGKPRYGSVRPAGYARRGSWHGGWGHGIAGHGAGHAGAGHR